MKQNVITTIGPWLGQYAQFLSQQDQERMRQAYDLVKDSDEAMRYTCFARAGLVVELRMNIHCILAAFLSDFVAVGMVNKTEVNQIVKGEDLWALLTRLNETISSVHESVQSIFPKLPVQQQVEQLRRMLLASISDVRVILIFLADRLQYLREAAGKPDPQRRMVAEQASQVYAPLANRLGIGQLKWEMEDWSFRFLHPDQYKSIAKWLDEKRQDREAYIKQFVAKLSELLEENHIHAKVFGRAKHIYSIWKKMQRKSQSFDQLFDIRAVRILVDTEVHCYTVLGIVHTQWQAIPTEFDDYIAVPKENQYQSLHTAVIGPEDKTVEVQIRTIAMHEHAEYGVAAHWAYKEGRKNGEDSRLVWLRNVADSLKQDEPDTLLDDQLNDERIYAVSPQGKILDFPAGATPVDFAYAIHTEVGHRCRGAKVNGKMVSLSTPLKNGDTVEILTAKNGHPSRDWLNQTLGYVHTAKSRAKIREWFRRQDFEENLQAGRGILEKELKRLNFHGVSHENLAKLLHVQVDELFSRIGRGEISMGQVISALHASRPKGVVKTFSRRKPKPKGEINILGVGNLLTHLATCCKPIVNDPIVGFITRGKGVTVHRVDCANVLHLPEDQADRLIQVDWVDNLQEAYPVDIRIDAYDRRDLIKDISTLLANEKVNLLSIKLNTYPKEHTARVNLTAELVSVEQLSRILSKINHIPNVIGVKRV